MSFLKEKGKIETIAADEGQENQETGNSNVNMQLSESRATNVKDVLMKNGVAEGRIATDHKGDTVQPFEKAQQNRVVICTVE